MKHHIVGGVLCGLLLLILGTGAIPIMGSPPEPFTMTEIHPAEVMLSTTVTSTQKLYLPDVAWRVPPTPTPTRTPNPNGVEGYVQKGPFIQGTLITVAELDNSFKPTGRTFSGSIDDNSGHFSVQGTLNYPYVKLTASGFYFNEISGGLSTAPVTLLALADVRESRSINVNLLTHLEYARVLALVDKGANFDVAKVQAQREILAAFNIVSSTAARSEALDISQEGEGNAILLAISAVLQADRSEAQLTELLSILSNDLRADGDVDNSSTRQALVNGMQYLKPRRSTIASNIVSRYSELGITAIVPDFEAYAFNLDVNAPTIAASIPRQGANEEVKEITVVFSDFMRHATLHEGTIYLRDAVDKPVATDLTAFDTGSETRVKLIPSSTLLPGNYELAVSTGAQDLGSNSLTADAVIRFTHTPFNPKAEVFVSAGPFRMGCDSGNPAEICGSDELPLHTVILDPYYIDKYEVTNARYKECVAAGACTPPLSTVPGAPDPTYNSPDGGDYPVTFVLWSQAKDFCDWDGKRLPTEAEWEKAARGTDLRIYPWGNDAPACTLLNYDNCVAGGKTTRVGTYPGGVSPYGAWDMGGDVWEWVKDYYDGGYYSVSPGANPQGPATGDMHVARGGSWRYRIGPRTAYRGVIVLPDGPFGQGDFGFRCARSG